MSSSSETTTGAATVKPRLPLFLITWYLLGTSAQGWQIGRALDFSDEAIAFCALTGGLLTITYGVIRIRSGKPPFELRLTNATIKTTTTPLASFWKRITEPYLLQNVWFVIAGNGIFFLVAFRWHALTPLSATIVLAALQIARLQRESTELRRIPSSSTDENHQ